MDDDVKINSAVDAVRCLFLHKELQHLGHKAAGGRWRDKAMSWLEQVSAANPPPRQCRSMEENLDESCRDADIPNEVI